jgi:hypothetical protein
MADDRNERGARDRQRVNMSEDYEVAYWAKKWGDPRTTVRGCETSRPDVGSRG